MMTSRRRWTWSAVAGFAGLLAIALSASNDIWWPDYAGGPDSSRFFRLETNQQVQRRQAGRSPGPIHTARPCFNPIVVRGIDLRPRAQRRHRCSRREDRKGDLDPRRHDGHDSARHELLGEQGWQGSAADLQHERLPAGDRRGDRQVDLTFGTDGVVDLREGLGRDPATVGRIQSGTPGQVFENLILLGSATGEGYMSPPGDLRAYDVVTGKLALAVPHDPASRRVRLRDVAERRVEVRRRRQHLGRNLDRRRSAASRISRRDRRPTTTTAPIGRARTCFGLPGGARRANRQAALALPDDPPRSLGLRQQRGAAAARRSSGTAGTSTSSRSRGRPGSCTSSIA